MKVVCDIETPEHVKTLADAFYAKVNWPRHLPTMYRFWQSLLFGSGNYHGAPFPKHAVLPVQQAHFERWLTLFAETVDENFAGPKSEEAKSRAMCIADRFAGRMGVLTGPARSPEFCTMNAIAGGEMLVEKS